MSRMKRNSPSKQDGFNDESKEDDFNGARFVYDDKFTPVITLQGFVFHGIDSKTKKRVIIKRAYKQLVHEKLARFVDGNVVTIKPTNENIYNERDILEDFTRIVNESNNLKIGFSKFVHFCDDDDNYYLITEDVGSELLYYALNLHKKLKTNILKNFRLEIQFIFAQIVKFVLYFHLCDYVHGDLSLENTTIRYDESGENKFDPVVSVIDFGLARKAIRRYKNGKDELIRGDKRIGKIVYMAPEVLNANEKNHYDPFLSDVWSLGCILFIMVFGAMPPRARLLKGELNPLIEEWERQEYGTKYCFDLLSKIFVDAENRIDIKQVASHPYVKNAPKTLLNVNTQQQERYDNYSC